MSVRPWGEPGSGQPPGRQPVAGWQPVSAVSPQAAMRAGHADRDRTLDVLKAAFAEGRLTAQEYEQRHEAAAGAQTYGQLAALVADLPSGPMPMPAPPTAAPHPIPATFLPPPPSPPRQTSVLAVTSLALGLIGFSLPAVVTGHVARSQIRQRNMDGDWAAVLGLVIGYLGTAFWTLLILLGTV